MEGRKRRGEIGPIFPWPFNVRISCFEPSCKKLSFDTTIVNHRGISRIDEDPGKRWPTASLVFALIDNRVS